MNSNDINKNFEKPEVDEEYLMNIMSGNDPIQADNEKEDSKENKPQEQKVRQRKTENKKDYESTFLVSRNFFGRNGKVAYIRPEFHERLQRIVQLTQNERTSLYSYIDNILEHHFKEFGTDIQAFFDERNKPIF